MSLLVFNNYPLTRGVLRPGEQKNLVIELYTTWIHFDVLGKKTLTIGIRNKLN